jgi:hypothetical protein
MPYFYMQSLSKHTENDIILCSKCWSYLHVKGLQTNRTVLAFSCFIQYRNKNQELNLEKIERPTVTR